MNMLKLQTLQKWHSILAESFIVIRTVIDKEAMLLGGIECGESSSLMSKVHRECYNEPIFGRICEKDD